MGFNLDIDSRRTGAAFDAAFDAFRQAHLQRALLAATARGADRLKSRLRRDMQSAGLGRLGNAIGTTSDQADGRGVHDLGGGDFSAWGLVGVRSRSPRTRGAIEAYVGGAEITPKRGRWLWVPTDQVQRLAGGGKGRQRLTPGNWSSSGMDAKVGRLELIRSVDGRPLLIVRNVGVSAEGKRRSARSLTKSGRARKGQIRKEFIVAFIAIPRTARAARIDVSAIHAAVMAELPGLIASELRKG
jgi:hypothetical protein